MRFQTYFLALAAAALIAGCGGGEQASITPQAAVAALKAKASMSGKLSAAASPEAAAEQLFAYAEANLPSFFPGAQTTMSYPPFKFRYYAQTDMYLGVVVTAGMGYTLNGVYVAGGGLGTLANPYYAGLVTDFITPTGGGTGGSASACYDLSLADTQGTKYEVAYNYSGMITGTENVTTTVGGMTTFEGNSARETTVVTKGTHNTSQGSAAIDTTGKTYSKLTGAAEITQYGSVFDFVTASSGFTFTTNVKTVYNPAWITRTYSLAQGASITETSSGTSTSVTKIGFGQPDQTSSTTFSSSTTTKFVGIESVTVPAGTYSACKFEVTSDGSSQVTTSWIVVGKGFHVKTMVPDLTIEATSIKLNGAAQ